MKSNKPVQSYLLLGFLLCAVAGGMFGYFFETTSNISPDDIVSTALFIGSILLCLLILKDAKDSKTSIAVKGKKKKFRDLIRNEFNLLWKDLCCRTTRMGLLAYFLWATSQYTILILFTDFQIKYTATVILMMCGYLLGVMILGFSKKVSDEKIIRIGFLLTIASFLSFFITDLVVENNAGITAVVGFFYSIGNAFLSPSMLSLFSKERGIHNQGKGFGLIVSADSSGFLAGSIIVITINYLTLKIEYVFLISFLAFLISWIPYARYEKRRSNAPIS